MSTLKTNNIQHVDRSDPSIIINTDGGVSIAGTLTYEDVTNVDSVGIVTARGLSIFGNTTGLNATGVSTFTNDVTFTGAAANIIFDKSDNALEFADDAQARFGTDNDLSVYYNSSSDRSIIASNGARLDLRADSVHITSYDVGETMATFTDNGTVDLYYDNSKRFNTTPSGVDVTGSLNVSGVSTHTGLSQFANTINLTHASAGQNYIYFNEDLQLAKNGTGTRLKIDAGGRVIVGHTAALTVAGHQGHLQLNGDDYNQATFQIVNNENTANGSYIHLSKQRSGSAGGASIVQNSDTVGKIRFTAADGTNLDSRAAEIEVYIDGTPGENDTPGRMILSTTADGAQSTTERMRIDSKGRIGIQGAATKGVLDVRASGGAADQLTAVFGANEGTTAGTLSDNTDKACRIGSYHYDTDEEPFGILVASGTNGTNNLTFGGGTSLMNAATEIKFNTAANSTTTSGTERLRIASDGETTFKNKGGGTIKIGGSSAHTSRIVIADNAGSGNGNLLIEGGDGTDFMKFSSGGDILLGSATVNGAGGVGLSIVRASGLPYLQSNTNSTSRIHNYFQYNGTTVGTIQTTTGQTSFNNLSDYRSKENDVKITDGIEKIKLLRPIRFNYKVDKDIICDGFFAHEVTPAVPTAVSGEKDAVDSEGEIDPQMLDTGKIIPLLTAALQEAITEIETLKTKVAALEGS